MLRVAITGASSVGKTTLAHRLMLNSTFASAVGQFVPEGARELLTSSGFASFDQLTPNQRRDFQRRFFSRKADMESGLTRYLVDRSFVDVAAVWVERDTLDQPHEIQDELVIPCRVLAERYILHILVEQAVPFEADGVRESDLPMHRRVASRIKKYLEQWRLPHYCVRALDVDGRAEEVLSEFSRRKLIPPG
jgi:nicotinamide riboside kinase